MSGNEWVPESWYFILYNLADIEQMKIEVVSNIHTMNCEVAVDRSSCDAE